MRLYIFLFLSFFVGKLFSQNIDSSQQKSPVIISNIIVSGNKKTKTNIILREMLFKNGDTIAANKLDELIETSRQLIFNTTLFVDVTIHSAKLNNNEVSIIVLVKERWYLFPMPYFRLVDRNFNEWWVNQNHSLERVDYGIKFYHNNLSGNNDKLTIDLITGYSRQIGLRYSLPFINKKMTNGINFGFIYSKQKEVNYATSDENKLLFVKAVDSFLKNFTRVDFTFTNRPNLFLRHNFRIAYTSENIDSIVAAKNPNYYGNTQTELKYIDLSYNLSYSKNNYNAYPTQGFSGSIGASARVFSGTSDVFSIGAFATLSTTLSKKMFMRNRAGATIKLPFATAYINEPLFGYNPYQMRGLEYYVVDGVAGLLHKFTLGYQLFDFSVKTPIKKAAYQKIPFKIYAKVYNDFGYSYKTNATTLLNNKLMHGYGFGFDILTIYDIIFKFEYSFNQFGNSGLYFGIRD